jgi:hypothetical protein
MQSPPWRCHTVSASCLAKPRGWWRLGLFTDWSEFPGQQQPTSGPIAALLRSCPMLLGWLYGWPLSMPWGDPCDLYRNVYMLQHLQNPWLNSHSYFFPVFLFVLFWGSEPSICHQNLGPLPAPWTMLEHLACVRPWVQSSAPHTWNTRTLEI